MAILCLSVKKEPNIIKFMNDTKKRFKEKSFFIDGNLKLFGADKDKRYYGLSLEPTTPHLYLMGLCGAMMVYVITGKIFTSWNIISFIFLTTYIPWRPEFYYVILRLGLKHNKIKTKGKIKRLNSSNFLKELIRLE